MKPEGVLTGLAKLRQAVTGGKARAISGAVEELGIEGAPSFAACSVDEKTNLRDLDYLVKCADVVLLALGKTLEALDLQAYCKNEEESEEESEEEGGSEDEVSRKRRADDDSVSVLVSTIASQFASIVVAIKMTGDFLKNPDQVETEGEATEKKKALVELLMSCQVDLPFVNRDNVALHTEAWVDTCKKLRHNLKPLISMIELIREKVLVCLDLGARELEPFWSIVLNTNEEPSEASEGEASEGEASEGEASEGEASDLKSTSDESEETDTDSNDGSDIGSELGSEDALLSNDEISSDEVIGADEDEKLLSILSMTEEEEKMIVAKRRRLEELKKLQRVEFTEEELAEMFAARLRAAKTIEAVLKKTDQQLKKGAEKFNFVATLELFQAVVLPTIGLFAEIINHIGTHPTWENRLKELLTASIHLAKKILDCIVSQVQLEKPAKKAAKKKMDGANKDKEEDPLQVKAEKVAFVLYAIAAEQLVIFFRERSRLPGDTYWAQFVAVLQIVGAFCDWSWTARVKLADAAHYLLSLSGQKDGSYEDPEFRIWRTTLLKCVCVHPPKFACRHCVGKKDSGACLHAKSATEALCVKILAEGTLSHRTSPLNCLKALKALQIQLPPIFYAHCLKTCAKKREVCKAIAHLIK
ncbi:hypothetical protein GNI_142960 [Gregarina niphandrodes]|uniref:Uncharacterized protein n=1 Tax=Gregarina niphandrodes TaxID=110365 RepID=A0A023B034_GRENI|nr:hypothetical protein GNI_142960 [Gregarina niphandrodes]EZG44855.1 hypothetical protein GNI_142960 [Gregarina niphandrodes]|eukprot:XP_011132639.1 hypothetical protein GNI_142960 [Gregarina niphandrodes]